MGMLLFAFAAFATGFLAQLVVWRLRLLPRTMGVVWIIVVASHLAILFNRHRLPFGPVEGAELVRASLLGLLCALCWISFYTSVELDSTTAVVLLRLREAGTAGAPRQDLHALVTDETAVLVRLDELQRARLVQERGGRYRLAPAGWLLLTVARGARRLLTPDDIAG